MTANVHFVYRCEHILKLESELVPNWLLQEYFNGIDFDPNTWQGLTHDYGTLSVDDLCTTCKEEASKKRREEAAKGHGEGKDANSTINSPSTASEKSTNTAE
jgi:hypothetical protein